MKPTKSILILLSLFLISNCGDKVREEITERYDDGKKKTIMKFKGSGSEEVMIEKISYSPSGDTLIREKNGKRLRGLFTDYYENGQIKSEGNYKDGELDGKWTSYYENGQIEEEGNYKGCCTIYGNSFLDGMWTYYHSTGWIKLEEHWKDGKRHGKSTYYHENGQIRIEGFFQNGEYYDKWNYYQEDGTFERYQYYKDGKLKKSRWRGYQEQDHTYD